MVSPEQELLLEEATDILLRLHQSPDDPAASWAKSAFLERGAAERAAFAMAERAWSATGSRKKPRRPVWTSLAAAAVVLLALFAWSDLHLLWLADHRTSTKISKVQLPSGDHVTLGAETALADATDQSLRKLNLLQGTAFFDVERDGRRFEVSAGEFSVEVLGTSFEVARIDRKVQVAVTEGRVAVLGQGRRWELTPGERFRYAPGGAITIERIGIRQIAPWREGRLVADKMPLGEFATIVDRYLPGPVLVISSDLSEARITGSYNLTDPLSALRSAAATTGARVVTTPLALTFLVADQ